ncbi:unnamed protein product [Pleuronectes platessa]|uniref:Uncharacterized protein n=1 Tax=Pleuronectes platessa TaxID=8262 RepID=A0A9N7YC85_PLEPL|nr:unnamed protein product [Pleuronectes platessa]
MQMGQTGDRTIDLQVGGQPLYPSATAALVVSVPSLPQDLDVDGQSMVINHPDHDPPSRPDATPVLSHRPPPPTRTHHEPPPRSWSTTRAQCQHDTGSATSTTISPHDSESATLDPTPRSTNRNPWCGHRGPGSAGDKAKGFRGRGIGMEKRKEKL